MTTLTPHLLTLVEDVASRRLLRNRCAVNDADGRGKGGAQCLRLGLLGAVLMTPVWVTPLALAADGAVNAIELPESAADMTADMTARTTLQGTTQLDAKLLETTVLETTQGQENRGESMAIPVEVVTPEEELLGRMETVDSVRIVMHALAPADRLSNQVSSLLSALGATQVEQRIVAEVPEHNQVRYYHPADREAGQVVGDALSLVFDDVAVRDFGDYQPVPSEGLIEIWLR